MKTKYIFLYCLLFICNAVTAQKVITGAEQMGRLLPILKGKRVALVVNQTSKVGETHLLDTLLAAHIQIKRYSLPNTASGVMPMPEKPSGTEKIPAREYPSCPFTVKIRNLQPHSYRT